MARENPNFGLSRRTFLKYTLALGSVVLTRNLPNISPLLSAQAEGLPPLPPDFDLPDAPDVPKGHFFRQTRGDSPENFGFTITNDPDANFWDAFRGFGGVPVLGYPISGRFTIDNIPYQATQNAFLQKNPETGEVVIANLLDLMNQKGLDGKLYALGVPRHSGEDDGAKKDWQKAKEVRLGWLSDAEIKELYFAKFEDPTVFYGLPTSRPEKTGPFIAQRFQRVVIIKWTDIAPLGQPPGTIQFANIGSIAKELKLIPQDQAQPLEYPYPQYQLEKIKKYKTDIIVRRGDPNQKYVYPTFDDFWDAAAGEIILNVAKEKGIKLTLFPAGSAMGRRPDLWRRAFAEGHDIENHTFSHKNLTQLSEGEIRREITLQWDVAKAIINDPSYKQRFLRPPGGSGGFTSNYDPRMTRICQELGYKIAMWSADSQGYRKYPSVDPEAQRFTISNIKKNLYNGSIVLQHAENPDVAVLPYIIDEMKNSGFSPIKLSEGIE